MSGRSRVRIKTKSVVSLAEASTMPYKTFSRVIACHHATGKVIAETDVGSRKSAAHSLVLPSQLAAKDMLAVALCVSLFGIDRGLFPLATPHGNPLHDGSKA